MTVERDNDRNPVVALREIAEGSIDLDNIRQDLISGLQKHVESDEPEEEGAGFGAAEGELLRELMPAGARPAPIPVGARALPDVPLPLDRLAEIDVQLALGIDTLDARGISMSDVETELSIEEIASQILTSTGIERRVRP